MGIVFNTPKVQFEGPTMNTNTRKPSHPGAILRRDYMKPLNLTVTDLAAHLGISRKHLSQVIHGRASVTAGLALRLARAFGTTPELWLNLQRKCDLWEAERETSGLEDVALFIITPEEKKRRDRVFRDASASCAIEGLKLSSEDRKLIKSLYITCETSDEMVMRYKQIRGYK